MRIVSLLPSATEILGALGLAEQVVGISHSCDYPAAILGRPRLSRPIVNLDGLSSGEIDVAVRRALHERGSVYEIDVEQIRALAPDLILTQGICDVCAVPEQQVQAALAMLPNHPRILTLDAHDLAAIYASIHDVGCVTGTSSRAATLVRDLQSRYEVVRQRTAARRRPRVLALEWLDPPYAPGHWVPEIIAAAGGDLVAGVAGRPSFRMAWEDLPGLRADIVVVMPCGFTQAEADRERSRFADRLAALAPRVISLDASAYFSRSGPRVIDGLEVLAAAIFPEC